VAEVVVVPAGNKFEGAQVAALSTEDLRDLLASPRRSQSLSRAVECELRRRARAAKIKAAKRARRASMFA
jgi:hypothetical protein